MTINGMPVDPDVLAQVEANTSARLDILRHQIAESTGGGVNPDHDYQIRAFLYERCGLAVPFLTRTGQRSVCDAALQQLDAQHPVVAQIRDYRSRRNSLTMCRSLAHYHCPQTGCVHGTLTPLGAATGRFSCREPNLHGVPGIVRHAVRARDEQMLLEADISQAEYRVLAHFTRDPGLVEVFQAGNVDLHKQTMALVLGKAVDDVTPAERKVGKVVNFGIIYGETEHGLSRQLGIGVAEARGFIDGFFRGRPAVRDWIESIKQQVRHNGYVQTLSGRRRDLPAIRSGNSATVAKAERQAVNTVIQGTAADLMKLMLTGLRRSLPEDCRMLMTVHDSILLEVASSQVSEVARIVQHAMEGPMPGFSIPIRVDVHAGADWASCKSS
jgi:DNA polymerase-1